MPEAISPSDLVPMDLFLKREAMKIDLVYAQRNHPENIFGIDAYHNQARLILHKDLARIVLLVSRLIFERHGWTLVLKDGLRTTEAQRALVETEIVRENPHWLEEPRLLSGTGQGAHPRGMAIDVSAEDKDGIPVDMGTVFDEMTAQSARDYDGFDDAILHNRQWLETAFVEAAGILGLPMLPLPSEWWDFRFPATHYGAFAPLSDDDLPVSLKMHGRTGPVLPEPDFERLAKDILLSI